MAQVVDGKLVRPEYTADELDGLISVENHGIVGGHEFLVCSAPGDDLDIYTITVPEEMRGALGLEGNPYDGWWARVPADAVTGLHERVRPRSSWPGRQR